MELNFLKHNMEKRFMKKNILAIVMLFAFTVSTIQGKGLTKQRGSRDNTRYNGAAKGAKAKSPKAPAAKQKAIIVEQKTVVAEPTIDEVINIWGELKLDKTNNLELYRYVTTNEDACLRYAFFIALGEILKEEMNREVQLNFNVKKNNPVALDKMKNEYIDTLNRNIDKFSKIKSDCASCKIFFSSNGQKALSNNTKFIISNIKLDEFRKKSSIRSMFSFRDITKKFINLVKEFMPLIKFGLKNQKMSNEEIEKMMFKTMVLKINQ